ncbi:MAG: hypothetical protein P4L90_28180 [Rhodopila sp.]|nr:hypothetical protein [Rhodopila sp.]
MKIRRLATMFTVGLGRYASLLAAASAQTLKIGVITALTGGGAPWGMATQYGPAASPATS